MDVKELSQLSMPPEQHWYYASKFELLAATVKSIGARRVADIGAGSGVFARLLLERTDCMEAVCIDPAYAGDHEERVGSKILRFRRQPAGEDFDLVLLMDVLEHVDDDVDLLRETVASLKPGTPLFITVPAFQFLWSSHDVFLDHRRRYTAALLDERVRAAGLRTEWTRYFYAAIFPVATIVRLLRRNRDPAGGSDLRPTPAAVNWLLRKAMAVERRMLFPLNRWAGLSVVALARR